MTQIADGTTTPTKKGLPDSVFYGTLAVLTLLAASSPYLFGVLNTPAGSVYTGTTYNPVDTAVYLSWMRQVVDGSFFQRNLFAVEPQRGMVVNLFGLLLGGTAKLLGGNLIATYHVYRILFGGLLLFAVYRLIHATLEDQQARRFSFALVCVASGLGWVTGAYNPALAAEQPVDLWQPETVTFLSVYYAPLFTAAQALMVVFVLAALRVERSGKIQDSVLAAVSAALLANFHTYDVVPLFAFWFVYRSLSDVVSRRFSLVRWGGFFLALAMTVPVLAYQYFALILDPIFQQRNVKTETGSPLWVALGLGIPLVLSLVAVIPRRSGSPFVDGTARNALALWMVSALTSAYLPVDFQRKLLMGIHLSVCVLAGAGIQALTVKLRRDVAGVVAWGAVLLTVPSNALFLLQDMDRLKANASSNEIRPYLTAGESEALDWLRKNSARDEIIFCSPDPTSQSRFPGQPLKPYLSILIPAWTGNRVYNGHDSETPRYGDKFAATIRFFAADTPEAGRAAFLRENDIQYIVYSNRLAEGPPSLPDGSPVTIAGRVYEPVRWTINNSPKWLKVVSRTTDVTVYRVALTAAGTGDGLP